MNPAYGRNGRNYLRWLQIVKNTPEGKGKAQSFQSFEWNRIESWWPKVSCLVWSRLDDYVLALKLDATGNKKNYMFLPTAKGIWETVCQTYSKVQDAGLIYEIKARISTTKQGILSVTKHYNMMTGFLLEMDHYNILRWNAAMMPRHSKTLWRGIEFLTFLVSMLNSIRFWSSTRERKVVVT